MKKLFVASLLGLTITTSAVLPVGKIDNAITAQAKTPKVYKVGVKVSKSNVQVKKIMAKNKKKTGNAYYNDMVLWTEGYIVEKGIFKTMDTNKAVTSSAEKLAVHQDFQLKKGYMYYKNKKFTGVMKEVASMPAYRQVSYYFEGKLVSFSMEILGENQVKQ